MWRIRSSFVVAADPDGAGPGHGVVGLQHSDEVVVAMLGWRVGMTDGDLPQPVGDDPTQPGAVDIVINQLNDIQA